jgi:hypothetical protein
MGTPCIIHRDSLAMKELGLELSEVSVTDIRTGEQTFYRVVRANWGRVSLTTVSLSVKRTICGSCLQPARSSGAVFRREKSSTR